MGAIPDNLTVTAAVLIERGFECPGPGIGGKVVNEKDIGTPLLPFPSGAQLAIRAVVVGVEIQLGGTHDQYLAV